MLRIQFVKQKGEKANIFTRDHHKEKNPEKLQKKS